MAEKNYEPAHGKASFRCPHCSVVSAMSWRPATSIGDGYGTQVATCSATDCRGPNVWVGLHEGRLHDVGPGSTPTLTGPTFMVWPSAATGPPPAVDMPRDVSKDYVEAQRVLPHSPRAAGALLRLALQRLMKDLGQEGKNINADIGMLVAGGLSPQVAKAADIVRVTGNDAVHPGQIDTDDAGTVGTLFSLLNYIVEQTITRPAELDAMFSDLPEDKLAGIERRDGGGQA